MAVLKMLFARSTSCRSFIERLVDLRGDGQRVFGGYSNVVSDVDKATHGVRGDKARNKPVDYEGIPLHKE